VKHLGTAAKVLTVLPALIDFGKWLAERIRARRAARRAGKTLPVDADNLEKAFREGSDLAKTARDIAQEARGRK
jgi:hypothetical protein